MFIQPIVKYLRNRYPTCKIVLATAPSRIPLLADWPKGLLDGVLTVPFSKEFLESSNYHLTFEGSIERCDESSKMNYFDIFKKVAHVKFDLKDFYPELIPNEFAIDTLKDVSIPENMVMVHMKSSTSLKNLELSKWKIIIDKLVELGYNVGIIDSRDKYAIYEHFIQTSNFDRNKVMNLSCYSLTVNYGIALLDKCVGLIGIDSSFTHFAAALEKPLVGIYGAFPGHLTTKHYKYAASVDPIDWNECGMYPCLLGPNMEHICPYLSEKKVLPGCINSIDPERVVNKFHEIMIKYKEDQDGNSE
jgi:ADP-heptose:LPS heptosyltransferase